MGFSPIQVQFNINLKFYAAVLGTPAGGLSPIGCVSPWPVVVEAARHPPLFNKVILHGLGAVLPQFLVEGVCTNGIRMTVDSQLQPIVSFT